MGVEGSEEGAAGGCGAAGGVPYGGGGAAGVPYVAAGGGGGAGGAVPRGVAAQAGRVGWGGGWVLGGRCWACVGSVGYVTQLRAAAGCLPCPGMAPAGRELAGAQAVVGWDAGWASIDILTFYVTSMPRVAHVSFAVTRRQRKPEQHGKIYRLTRHYMHNIHCH